VGLNSKYSFESNQLRNRVFLYITRSNELLVFDHIDQRYLAPQIPGGTVECGEEPAVAALREATEETGLSGLRVVRLQGSCKENLASVGKNEHIQAWFYHLETNEVTERRWRHVELDPSDGADPIEFELYWVGLSDVPTLGGLDGRMLPKLRSLLGNRQSCGDSSVCQ